MRYITIVSARVNYEHLDPYNTFLWKQMAFKNIWSDTSLLQSNDTTITNMISFGDSTFEMEAASAFAEGSPNPNKCFLKLIKLKESPTFDELKSELDVVLGQYETIFSSVKNLKIKLERGAQN